MSEKQQKPKPDDITTKAGRARLAIQKEPHWLKLSRGAFLGYRRGPDTWIARYRDRLGKQHFTSLGQSDDYSAVRKRAELWCQQLGAAAPATIASAKSGTVQDALDAYLLHLRRSGRGKAAEIAESKFGSCIAHDVIAGRRLFDCTNEDFEQWRERIKVDRHGRALLPQTVNRYVGAVTAALNYAVTLGGHTGNPIAWALTKLPTVSLTQGQISDEEAAVYISKQERARLLKNAEPALQLYLRALYASGARPSEIANAYVRDYDAAQNTLTLRMLKGRPARMRARIVELMPDDAKLFKDLAKGKAANQFLLLDENGMQWTRHHWALGIRTAIAYANASATPSQLLQKEISAYSFRHSRISELLQVYKIDAVTVARQTGTSLAMMERYYWKFIPSSARDQFSKSDAA